MAGWLIWVLAGLVLLGAELMLPGAFLIWAGLAAAGTGGIVWATAAELPAAVALFLALLALGIGAAMALRRRTRLAGDPNAHGAGLLGREGIVLATTGTGTGLRVRVGDSDWPARAVGASPAPRAGARVRVEGVEGLTLAVRAAEEPDG